MPGLCSLKKCKSRQNTGIVNCRQNNFGVLRSVLATLDLSLFAGLNSDLISTHHFNKIFVVLLFVAPNKMKCG